MARARIALVWVVALFVAGCVSISTDASPSPTPAASILPTATPSPAATPGPTATALPTPSPSAGPAETPATFDAVIARLQQFSLINVPFALDMSATFEGTAGGEDQSGTAHMSGDAKGQSFSGTVVLTQPGVTVSADEVIINDTAWVRRTGSSDWRQAPYDVSQPIQPLVNLTNTDLTYVEVVTVSGHLLHRIEIKRWTGADFKTLGLKKAKLTLIKFEALVDNLGYPESIELDYNLTGKLQGQDFDVTYHLSYTLSDFNKQVTIEPPI